MPERGKNMPEKKTEDLSLPRSRQVRGVTVRRLNLGEYIQAARTLREAPGQLIDICFPREGDAQILGKLQTAEPGMLAAALGNLLGEAPQFLVQAAATLIGVDEQRLLTDPAIGLDGLMDILLAWAEVNRLGDFPPAARRLWAALRAAPGGSRPQTSGSSA
jgi:hypothetical protein